MSLHTLINSLQKLAISSSISQVAIRNTNGSCIIHRIFTPYNNRQLHISAACCRRLDSHEHPPFTKPSSKNKRWVVPEKVTEYTTKKIPWSSTGGRGPNGRIWVHRQGGEGKRYIRMVDHIRGGGQNEDEELIEKIEAIINDPLRSGKIALVAAGERKRYIVASQSMKVGNLIKSTTKIAEDMVKAREGDSHPLGSLPLGTLVNSLPDTPGGKAKYARAAGSAAVIIRKIDNKVIVRLPSKREMSVSEKCTGTVGRVSNIDNSRVIIGKAGRNRWRGIRPKSGRWHRKTGRDGRKIKGPRPVKVPEPSVRKNKFSNEVPLTFADTRFYTARL